MSKAIGDLIDRIIGISAALKGVKANFGGQNVEVNVVAPAPDSEEAEHAKHLVDELKAVTATLEAEVAKETKVPESAASPSGEPKSKAK